MSAGYIADKFGYRSVTGISVVLMALTTLSLSFLPAFSVIPATRYLTHLTRVLTRGVADLTKKMLYISKLNSEIIRKYILTQIKGLFSSLFSFWFFFRPKGWYRDEWKCYRHLLGFRLHPQPDLWPANYSLWHGNIIIFSLFLSFQTLHKSLLRIERRKEKVRERIEREG